MSGYVAARGGCLALLAILILAPAWLRAQEPEPPAESAVYLPVVLVPPSVGPIEFTDQLAEDTPVHPRTVFEHGIERMYASVLIQGGQGLFWRIEWDYPPGGTVRFDCRDVANTAHCPIEEPVVRINPLLSYGDGRPLERGVYHVRIYLEDVLYRQGTAEIR